MIPIEGGYLLDVIVQKELEDLDKPEHATAGGATLRHDGSIVRQEGASGRYSVTLGWIPLGRDVTLEQRILADLRARLDLGDHGGGHGGHGSGDVVELPMVEEVPAPRVDALHGGPPIGPELLPQALERLPSPLTIHHERGATGSLIVNAVPLPTVLSTRMRPWWASMICLQAERPRPVPPRPLSSGPVLVV